VVGHRGRPVRSTVVVLLPSSQKCMQIKKTRPLLWPFHWCEACNKLLFVTCLSGFGTKMLEPTRPLSTSTEEFAIERYSEIMSGSNHKCKCLKVIFVWAEYYFLIPFLSLVNVRNKSRFDPSALRLSIPRTKFKEFCTALVSLIVFRESSIEIK